MTPEAIAELRRSWRIMLAAIVASVFTGESIKYWFGVLIEPLSRAFGQSTSAISAWMAIAFAALILSSPLAGMFTDRFGSKRAAVIGIACVFVGFLLLAWLGEHRSVFYGTAVLVFAGAGLSNMGWYRAINAHFRVVRGTVLGMFVAGLSIVGAFGPRALQDLIDLHGWRYTFIAAAGASLIPLPLALLWLGSAGAGDARQGHREGGVRVALVLRSSAFWLLAAASFLFGLTFSGLITNLVPVLTSEGMDRTRAAVLVGGISAGALVGKLLMGALIDFFSVARLCALMALANGAAIAVLCFWPGEAALPSVAVLGLTEGAITVSLPYCVSRYFGLKAYGSVFAALLVVSGISVSGAVLFNVLKEFTGSYDVPLLSLSGAMLISAGFWAFLHRHGAAAERDFAEVGS